MLRVTSSVHGTGQKLHDMPWPLPPQAFTAQFAPVWAVVKWKLLTMDNFSLVPWQKDSCLSANLFIWKSLHSRTKSQVALVGSVSFFLKNYVLGHVWISNGVDYLITQSLAIICTLAWHSVSICGKALSCGQLHNMEMYLWTCDVHTSHIKGSPLMCGAWVLRL